MFVQNEHNVHPAGWDPNQLPERDADIAALYNAVEQHKHNEYCGGKEKCHFSYIKELCGQSHVQIKEWTDMVTNESSKSGIVKRVRFEMLSQRNDRWLNENIVTSDEGLAGKL
jgi:hypothetical protein